jgi:hypothetical protein
MKVKDSARHALAILGASATVMGMWGCDPRNSDINQVQPGYVRKAIFQTDDEWYYRRTIAESEQTNEMIIEGHGDIALDRVKFKIQEDVLIAYKPYEAIAGTGNQERPFNNFYEGTVLAAWPISSHFDIQRGYDSLTGNETNVISENAADRVWHERDYMRVDWSNNLIAGSVYADYSGYWFPVSYVSTGDYWTNLETSPTDEFASRFTDDYVEVTDHAIIGMDLLMCAAYVGYSWAGYGNCGYGEATVRHGFLRIKEKSDYVPRVYPDSYVRKNADGTSISDPDTGEVLREPIYNRFGIFRIEVPTFDRGYGYTETGRIFRAMLFNIWENNADADGKPLAYKDRTPKPIIYYLNADYPARYRQVASEVAAEYSRVYTSMVVDLKCGQAVDVGEAARNACAQSIPAMFEIRTNDCNEDNIVSFVSSNPDYLFAVERGACSTLTKNGCSIMNTDDVRKHVGFGNLTKVCTSLEAATLDPNTGISEFSWQRIGDPRYSMVVWLNNPQMSPWGGYGPMHADARTGETVSGTAFLRGWSYEVGAANVVDYIELINDETSEHDTIFGQQVRRQVSASLARKSSMLEEKASQPLLAKVDSRISRLGSTKEQLLRENDNPRWQAERLAKLNERSVLADRVASKVMNSFDVAMADQHFSRTTGLTGPNATQGAVLGSANPGLKDAAAWGEKWGTLADDTREKALPLSRLTAQNPVSRLSNRAQTALGAAGYCFLQHKFDPHWAGLALKLKDLPREKRYEVVASRLVKHVMLHELGHNVGLAHNFEGSYDALNYDDKFWNQHWAGDQEKIEGQYDEFRHTTVMEYMSMKGLFNDFLGKYDEAAIRFAYGEQVATFNSPSFDTTVPGGESLRSWRYYNDYNKIPEYLCNGASCSQDEMRSSIRDRKWVTFDPQNPPANEVPFLFCDNYYDRMTPFCATFDYGSSLKEIFTNYYTMWSQYFFFNNFIRDRLTPLAWSPNRAMSPVFYAFDFVDIVAQYFYYLNVTNPAIPVANGAQDFRTSDLKSDMATTLALGLNMATEIISTPEPVVMCPWPGVTPKVYMDGRFNLGFNCDSYADLNSQYAIDAQMVQIPLGEGRPASIGFTEDYEEWDWAYVGSYFDKSNVMMLLGWTSPTILRFNYDLDRKNYYIGLYKLFEPELKTFYRQLMQLDGFFLRPSTAEELGSYWCRDEETPGVASMGRYEPRKMIDVATGTSLPGPSATCQDPGILYPTLLTNMPYQAMLVAHALLSNDFDSQLNMGKTLKVYVKGADDDYADYDALPNCETAAPNTTCFCALTDSLTKLEYRSINFADAEEQSVGCGLITLAADAQAGFEASTNDPKRRDNWRAWMERLEYARDLYRLFNHR